MKRLITCILFLLLVSCSTGQLGNLSVQILEAQTFPFTVHAETDAPVDPTVTYGFIKWDNAAPVQFTVVISTTCAFGTQCVHSPTFSVPDNSVHTASITWANSFLLQGPAATVSFSVKSVTETPKTTGQSQPVIIRGGS